MFSTYKKIVERKLEWPDPTRVERYFITLQISDVNYYDNFISNTFAPYLNMTFLGIGNVDFNYQRLPSIFGGGFIEFIQKNG